MAVVSAEEITNLYLYGKKTVPTDLTSDALIRSASATTALDVNINDYMSGPGRFATVEKFDLIKEFFNPQQYEASSSVAPGRYTKKEMMEALGFTINGSPNRFAGIELSQALLDDGKDDFVERAYIWNTVSFKVHDDVVFVIGADGARSIENFAIAPYSANNNTEDFDFKGGILSTIANIPLETPLDPSGIGRKVVISFDGVRATAPRLTYEDYAHAIINGVPENYGNYARLATNFFDLIKRLFDSGSVRFLDGEGRGIVYGTNDADSAARGTALATMMALHPQRLQAMNGGFVFVAGDGNDEIEGNEQGDMLLGGKGNDTLNGGAGDDQLLGGEGDDNFAAHGVIDLDGKRGSYISFASVPGELGPHQEFLLELMVPHLHQVLVRILHQQRYAHTFSNAQLLTPKERVVLQWLAAGKSNPEIAALLNRSVSTIRNQVHSILGKLGASSRAEALHKSHEFGLL